MKLEYFTERNLYLIPIKENGTPAIHNWQTLRTNDPDKFRYGFACIGSRGRYFVKPRANIHRVAIVTVRPLIVIDIDQNHNKLQSQSAKTILDFMIKTYSIPDTFIVETKRGGYHIYLYVEPMELLENLNQNSLKRISKQIDLKCNNSYVVAPDGNQYKIINDNAIAVLPFGSFFSMFGKQTVEKTIKQEDCKKEWDILPENMVSYKLYIDKVVSKAVKNLRDCYVGNRNSTLFRSTVAISNFIHYGFYTEKEVFDNLYNIMAYKSKFDNWGDWTQEVEKETRDTILSGIKKGVAGKKFIPNKQATFNKAAKELKDAEKVFQDLIK